MGRQHAPRDKVFDLLVRHSDPAVLGLHIVFLLRGVKSRRERNVSGNCERARLLLWAAPPERSSAHLEAPLPYVAQPFWFELHERVDVAPQVGVLAQVAFDRAEVV